MEELSKQMESLTSESKCIDSTVVILNYVLKELVITSAIFFRLILPENAQILDFLNLRFLLQRYAKQASGFRYSKIQL